MIFFNHFKQQPLLAYFYKFKREFIVRYIILRKNMKFVLNSLYFCEYNIKKDLKISNLYKKYVKNIDKE